MRIHLQNFKKTFGDTTVIEDMNLTVEDGEMIALLGPSGCGKSTTLFAISGIHKINGGTLHFGDKDVTNLPAQERSVGVVFQNYALYPHMSVAQNIGFPLKVQKLKTAEINARVGEIAELVQIGNLLDRKPMQLSGGQQQRVALARALIRKPDVLLLDEPLANLDAKLRLEMRSEIRRLQRETGITAILVTHDQIEAMSMCDRIALMKDGRIEQISTPTQMYESPASHYVASFLGNPPISFLQAKADASLDLGHGNALPLPIGKAVQGELTLGIRPEHFGPQHDGPKISGQISFIEPQGREDLIDVMLPCGQKLRAIAPSGHGLKLEQDISWGTQMDRLHIFGADGTRL
ncbi:ABC transporter ATP-binding protein [Pacificibacter marinus]|uniref:Maltose/maltodextrin import ATP-binding protein MalK n=1 Tax=Pacificibacter marinus TaxID=658057 RepID=A0A1Y5SIS2_9RHOB|nr:ABC transporter ATP-binding protein [Pacificibacter marinus]SEK53161.1 carbohydrate ABC transporter ATP-binding protein, CUT1 family [Pacificibacter marinus]SLN38744.1 Maltose/maltodextrin import ATP-binding protein MalK [Pacificibacter marinus]